MGVQLGVLAGLHAQRHKQAESQALFPGPHGKGVRNYRPVNMTLNLIKCRHSPALGGLPCGKAVKTSGTSWLERPVRKQGEGALRLGRFWAETCGMNPGSSKSRALSLMA